MKLPVLSVRPVWAWLILHAGKNIENRDWSTNIRGDVLLHASARCTRGDYEAAVLFCSGLPEGTFPPHFCFPTFDEVKLFAHGGGIVGALHIGNCVTGSDSPWFTGRYGFVIDRAVPLPFHPCKGRQRWFYLPTTEAA